MSDAGGIADRFRRLRPLAADLRYARPRVREMVDLWLAEREDAAPANFLHALMTGLEAVTDAPGPDPADPGDALALVLAALGTDALALDCFSAAVAAGLFDDAGPMRMAVRGTLVSRAAAALGEGARAVLQSAELEAFTDASPFWIEPARLLPAVLLGRRRMCRILVLNSAGRVKVTGSGFLIGPSTVLTNHHVVEDLLADPGAAARLRVEFDASATTGRRGAGGLTLGVRPDWCIAKSPADDSVPDAAYWWYDQALRQAWVKERAAKLDYAVLRLDGAPGLQRGWFDLTAPLPEAPNGVIVLHHPGDTGQTLTTGGVLFPLEQAERIFHLAATARGSSGGLALDETGRPLGLHYLGVPEDRPRPPGSEDFVMGVNVAVALGAIRADLERQGLLAEVARTDGIRPFRGSLDGRRPLFGRETLLAALERVWRGQPQILTVHVETRDPPLLRPGKSFTLEIVQSLFRPPEHHHIVFRAGDIRVDAYRLACDTVATFAPDLVARLPTAPDTTMPAYVRKLVATLGQILAERLGNRLVWIMLDDLDRHDLTDATGREFLATLYSLVGRMPNLRIVLVGLPTDLAIGGMDENDVISCLIEGADVTNLADRLTEWLKLRGGRDADISDAGYRLFARTVASWCGTEEALPRMAEFVANHVTAAADELFGSAVPPEGTGG